jgi:hypothetical protein
LDEVISVTRQRAAKRPPKIFAVAVILAAAPRPRSSAAYSQVNHKMITVVEEEGKVLVID